MADLFEKVNVINQHEINLTPNNEKVSLSVAMQDLVCATIAKNERYHDANFVVTCDTGGRPYDNFWCHQ